MRGGFKAWDADTHVNPAAEVLDRYVDPSFRPRLSELAPHRVASGQIGQPAACMIENNRALSARDHEF